MPNVRWAKIKMYFLAFEPRGKKAKLKVSSIFDLAGGRSAAK